MKPIETLLVWLVGAFTLAACLCLWVVDHCWPVLRAIWACASVVLVGKKAKGFGRACK